jgi:sugar phosphate permease
MLSRFATLSRIPKGVWVVGGVSMLMDISSEIIHSLLPLFMVTTLGASVIFIGLIEGLAEATALFIKVFSGAISDYLGKRKGLAVLGYGLGALSKPLFAIASSSGMILGARLIDRVGKGIRGAPRDALVGTSRRGLWAASVDGYRRRISRAAAGRRLNAAVER